MCICTFQYILSQNQKYQACFKSRERYYNLRNPQKKKKNKKQKKKKTKQKKQNKNKTKKKKIVFLKIFIVFGFF